MHVDYSILISDIPNWVFRILTDSADRHFSEATASCISITAVDYLHTPSCFVASSIERRMSIDSRLIAHSRVFLETLETRARTPRYQSALILGTDVHYLCHNKRTKREGGREKKKKTDCATEQLNFQATVG